MTRINCVPPQTLSRQHLVAEYRELPRIFKQAAAAYERGEDPDTLPDTYRLGTGHVKFFYRRQWWLRTRYAELRQEMRRRGYQVRVPWSITQPSESLPPEWQHGWEPTPEAVSVNVQRLEERS